MADIEARRHSVPVTHRGWVRAKPSNVEGIIDFDALVRDPAEPRQMVSQYDSGDHLHPNDAGYEAMGGVIDLAIFKD